MFPLIVLALVEVLSYGLLSGGIGFYHDDWHMLETATNGTGLIGTAAAFASTGLFPSRPANLIWLPPLYWLGGLNTFTYQLLLIGMDLSLGLLLYQFLKKLTKQEGFSLLAACLALMSPNRSVTHVWFSNLPQAIAMILALSSLICHLDWLGRRGPFLLALGQAAYMLSLLTYESAAFLPLMLAGGLFLRYHGEGTNTSSALTRTIKELFPFALTLATALLWQRFGLPAFFGVASPKSPGFSVSHIFKVYGAGFECLSNRVLHLCWKALPAAWNAFGPVLLLPGATLAFLLTRFIRKERINRPTEQKIILGAAFGGLIGAYAPYALSTSYMPQIFGLMSRTNAGGSIVLGILLAAAALRLSPKPQRIFLSLLAILFTTANWQISDEWSRSWVLQQDILRQVAPRAVTLPGKSLLILKNAPGYIGHAIVFDASWDFGPALRLTTGRNDLAGTVWNPRLEIGGDGVYIYDYGENSLKPARP